MQLDAQKSLLGKLMATEDIRVEHRATETAYFDLQNRTLALPLWKSMSSDLYDLLIGHEVGHALFTNYEEWDSAVKNNPKNFKTFLYFF